MPAQSSTACYLASLPASQRQAILAQLSDAEASALLYDWKFWARPAQLAPAGDWRTWAVIAGRGFGKSRTGAEWIRDQVERGRCKRLGLIARTAGDVRDVVVEGESGILAISPPWFRPVYEPSKRRLTWPNGAIATTFSADEPDALRGPQHDGLWCDELASWKFPEAWDMAMFGLRLGNDPRVVITTTPKPTKLLREILADPTTVVTKGSTFDNAGNLAKQFLDSIVKRYLGTRLGRQELDAELLTDTPGALWTRLILDETRVTKAPDLKRIVIAVDPSIENTEDSDECGIVVAGRGEDDHGYLLSDVSVKGTPDTWARRAVDAFKLWHADRIVAEKNQGGLMVSKTLHAVDPTVPVTLVSASRGKYVRAEPVSSLFEQHRCHLVGAYAELEDELTTWTQGRKSPNRLDAMVWGFSELMLGPKPFEREHVRPR